MRLKQIRLSGFKSFVETTKIPFPTDMTAIVGPNGCGKSNVIDAVRWVLGESSARNLRGDAMTDVIFNGSTRRAPVFKASVELVFDNQQQRLGGEYASYSEIAVRREVTREAQNTYFLNGAKCRKKDITDLFLGTGLGPRSYAIIEQGMISRLIESKPHELRVFIEEAAGVSKYKERRRETENRIKHTEENLSRLKDIEFELQQQVNKLKTQASAARRYREYRERHRQLKALIAQQELQRLDYQLDNFDSLIEQQQDRQQALQTEITQLENQLALAANQIADSQAQAQQSQQQLFELKTQLAKLEQQQRFHAQQQSQAEEQRAQLTQQQQQVSEQLTELNEQAEQLAMESEQAEEAMLVAEAAIEEQQQALELQHGASQSDSSQLAQTQQQWQQLQSQQQQLAAKRQHFAQLQGRHSQQVAQVEQQLAQLPAEQQHRLDELLLQQEESQAQLLELEELKLAEQQTLQQQQAQSEQAKQTLEQQRQTHLTISLKLENVEQLLANVPSAADQPLRDALSIDPNWAKACDAMLGQWLEAEYADELAAEHALALRSAHAEPLPRAQLLAGLPTLAAQIDGADLSYLCGEVMLVEQLEQAFALRQHLLPQQSLLTPQGEWLGRDWQCLNVGQGRPAVMSLRAEQQQLQTEVDDSAVSLTAAEQHYQQQQQALEPIQQQLDTLTSNIGGLNQQLNQLKLDVSLEQQQQQQGAQRAEQLNLQLEQLHLQQAEDEEQLLQLEASEEELQIQLLELEPQLAELQSRSERAHSALRQAEQQAQALQQQYHQAQLNAQQLASRQQHQQQSRAQLEQQLGQLNQQLERLATHQQIEDPAELQAQIEEILVQLVESEEQQQQIQTELLSHTEEQQQQQARLKTAQQQLAEVNQLNQDHQLQQQSLLTRRGVILEQLAEQGQDLKNLTMDLPEASLEQDYHKELEQVDQRLRRLGAVNLAAEEEFETQNQRYQELVGQIADLEAALEVLAQAITKIDKQTRARFRETFDKVDADLRQLFPKVFGGGTAWLELSSEDLLETGVTIMARPPGKKNASISLLSGGEKALTALALVFAIFRLNPAPFCMLDEVDAPLDEVNVGRFADLVHSMSDTVQFIFISHNKVTMEKASQLAGVTMQEPGVSRLVAVDIAEAFAMVE